MDRFDDIWKNRFNEEELPVGDWNTPDDMVWESISSEVIPKKDKRRWLWFWWSIGLMILLIVVGTILGDGKNEKLSNNGLEKMSVGQISSENKIVIIDPIVEDKAIEDSANSVKRQPTYLNVSPSKKQKVSFDNNKITSPQVIQEDNHSEKYIGPEPNSFINGLKQGTSSETSDFFKKSKTVIPLDGVSKILEKKSAVLIPLSVIDLEQPEWTHPVDVLPLFQLEDIVPPKKNQFSLGVESGFVFWRHRISDQYTSDLSPFDFNYDNSWGWQTSLDASWSWNQYFEIFTSIQYQQIRTTSGHNSNLRYSLANETNSTDPLNGYILSLATPYGLSGATFNFIRNQELNSSEVDLLVDFHSSHLIRNISVPVGTSIYPLGKKRKVTPNISLGFGANYLASISNQIQDIETNHDAIQYDDSGASTFVAPDLKKFHFDYRIGVGVNYELKRNLNLQLNYNWARGINPIYEFENYNTRIDRHHVTIGLTKSFIR